MMNLNLTETVKQLLIINIIFFIGSYIVGQPAMDILALHSPQSNKFYAWQLVTYMFMHGGIAHILFNMLALVSFGSLLERLWGVKKLLFFYFSCGLGAAGLHLLINYLEVQNILHQISYMDLSNDTIQQIINIRWRDDQVFIDKVSVILQGAGKLNALDQGGIQGLYDAAVVTQTPMVGASGAIYGIMVAFAFIAPNAELMMMFVPVPIKAKYFVPGLLIFDLVMGVRGQAVLGQGDGIAHFAHIGGALIGFIMMWYWKKNSYNNKRWN